MKLFNTYMTDKYNGMLVSSMLSMLLSTAMESTDYVIAGIYLWADGINVVNLISPVVQAGLFFAYLISIGVPIMYSERIGKFEKKAADDIFTMGVIVAAAIGIFFAAIMLTAGNSYLGLYSINPELHESALMYYRAITFALAFRPMAILLYTMVFIDGDSELTIVAVITTLICRVGFSILFVGRFGLLGLGFSAVLSILINLVLVSYHFFKKSNSLRLSSKPDFKSVPAAVKFSLVDSTAFLYVAAFTVLLNLTAQKCFGADALLAASVINFINGLYRCTDGIGATMEPFVNMYHGQGSYDGIRDIVKISMVWAAIIGLAFCIITASVAGPLAGYLGVTGQEMTDICKTGIRILALGFVLNSIIYCLTSYYLYIEKIGLGMIITLFGDFAMAIVGIMICSKFFGIIGLFVGIPVGCVLTLAGSLAII